MGHNIRRAPVSGDRGCCGATLTWVGVHVEFHPKTGDSGTVNPEGNGGSDSEVQSTKGVGS